MDYIFHIVQVNHTFYHIVNYLNLLMGLKLLFLFVELIEKTAILEKLSDENVFIRSYAHSHVQNNVWML